MDRRSSIALHSRVSSILVSAMKDSHREKMKKYANARAERISGIGSLHRYILETAAILLNTSVEELIDGIADLQDYCDIFDSFFKPGGRCAIIIHYQISGLPDLFSGRYDAKAPKNLKMKRSACTNGGLCEVSGSGIVATRLSSNKDLDLRNMPDLVLLNPFICEAPDISVVDGIEKLLHTTLVPAIHNMGDWGELLKTDEGLVKKDDFIAELDQFYEFIKAMVKAVNDRVRFNYNDTFYEKYLLTPGFCNANSRDPNIYRQVCSVVSAWIRQMESVVTVSQQLRREDDSFGPTKELEYWRYQLSRFECVIEHLKTPICQMYIYYLVVAKSLEIMKKWRHVDQQITIYSNECRDNVKYLRCLDKFLYPLYRNSPITLGNTLPTVINTIRMIYTNSRFFNTSERISPLFVKITNQLINVSRDFLTDNGTKTIWHQYKEEMCDKIEICLDLYSRYYQSYMYVVDKMKVLKEPLFNCSEMDIFGKYETFKKRLEEIADILEITLLYSILFNSTLEKASYFAKKFKSIYLIIAQIPTNPLNHRDKHFDQDYIDFKTNILKTETELYNYFENELNETEDVNGRLRVLERFDKLKLPTLEVENKYLDAMEIFLHEINTIRDIYNFERQTPEVGRCLPPVAGRIMWIRQLYKRLTDYMNIFKLRPEVMANKRSQKIVMIFNSLSSVFVQYEDLYHEGWIDFVDQVDIVLRQPVLLRDPRTSMFIINYDPYILETIREAEYMFRLKRKVPDIPHVLFFYKHKIFKSVELIKCLVENNNQLRTNIPRIFVRLTRPQLYKIDVAMKPALSTITWTSQLIEQFYKETGVTLEKINGFIKRVCDIKEIRIDAILNTITEYELFAFPETAIDSKELLEMNKENALECAKEMEQKSNAAELSAMELVNEFLNEIDDPDFKPYKSQWMNYERALKDPGSLTRLLVPNDFVFKNVDEASLKNYPQILSDAMDLFLYFSVKMSESIVFAIKKTLQMVKDRIVLNEVVSLRKPLVPIVVTYFELKIPDFVLKPTLDEMQDDLQKSLQCGLSVCKFIALWGQRGENLSQKQFSDKIRLEYDDKDYEYTAYEYISYYEPVANHKDTRRAIMSLATAITRYKPEVDELCAKYKRFEYIWDTKRRQTIKDFVDSNPTVDQIRDKFKLFDRHQKEIEDIEEVINLGCICILTERVKLALLIEAKSWKSTLGNFLSIGYLSMLLELMEYINKLKKALARPLKTLDDVRFGMAVLKEIRDNFIDLDMKLTLIEDIYGTFMEFNVDISTEDYDRVTTCRSNFNAMLETATEVQIKICEIQGPFAQDLKNRVHKLMEDVEQFDLDFRTKGSMIKGIAAKEASRRVIYFQQVLDDLWETATKLQNGEELFGMDIHEYPILIKRRKEYILLNRLYGLYENVMKALETYKQLHWADVDMEEIANEMGEFMKRIRKIPKFMYKWPAYVELNSVITAFNDCLPLLQLMSNKALTQRHWDEISQITGCEFDMTSETFTLGAVFEAPLLDHKDEIEDICVGAVKEQDIVKKLNAVIGTWSGTKLTFVRFKTRGEILLNSSDVSDLRNLLDDNLMIMNSLLINRYNAPYKKQIVFWTQRLNKTSDILEKWLIVQGLWIYLEAVFVGGDIAKQLPSEQKRFSTIDKQWVKIMLRARDNPLVIECCVGDETLTNLLPYLIDQLEACQKSLSGYLEIKRKIFPRFFFVSDPVLLEILGKGSDPSQIQEYMLSLFDSVKEVEFNPKHAESIIGLKSSWGEQVPLENNVLCIGGVENWLVKLLQEMKNTVLLFITNSYLQLQNPDFDIIISYPKMIGQASLLTLQFLWTMKAEEALIRAPNDKTIMKYVNIYFLEMLNSLIEDTTKQLNEMERTHLETLITIHLHQRDIFDDLAKARIKSLNDFDWLKQTRFYCEPHNEEILVRITDVLFIYQCEYLGVTERLCITPLTDRCYITLAQGIWMNQGGNPAGPAGTGKTETTKDMGRTLGKYVVVFNCSDQMDFRGLGRIFKGLSQSGTWGCFDEFNRIDLPVLSVAAQQIYILLTARKNRVKTFIFSDGDEVLMNIEFGVFLTMNPGYAGRVELPENLKIMFRSVAMMVPDRQIIIRVKLASCGFKNNISLARKFYTLYALCEGQLSKQVHYDFGLRNMLSVLRTLGAQKRANPNESEETVVMRVLREMNVSKMTNEDSPLLLSLIDDMFPGIKLTSFINKQLQKCIAHQCTEMQLINSANFNLKIVQLYDTSLVRHGLMTLGPTGSGKTCSMHVLQNSLTEMGKPHYEVRMNPKAITAPQMFGRLDVATNDWTDGIFSTLWRRTLKVKMTDTTWLVLDGPVDAVWIENLNSVLDDNKTLTLANGDRIVMAPNSKIVFEPDNVDNASPATVSRMGMVFLSSSVLKWDVLADGWFFKRTEQEKKVLLPLFNKIYEDAYTFVISRTVAKMNVLEAIYIRQTCDMLAGLIDYDSKRKVYPERHLERFFLFALMWSLGSLLELEDRAKFQEYVVGHKSKMKWPKVDDSSIFEYLVGDDGTWVHWKEKVVDYIYPTDHVPEYNAILVPNVDNVRTNFLIDVIARKRIPILLIGEQGTAKTVMIQGYMAQYDQEEELSKTFNFSSATTPEMVQRNIESYVEKRVGTTYGPPSGRKMTVFIDDINMPVVNDWGDQITNEIVRQLIEYGGFYSLDKPGEFSYIKDILIVAAMIHPGGGRNDIPNRLKRHVCIFNCTLPSDSSMDKIFSVIGEGYFCIERFNATVVNFIPQMIPLTRKVWQLTKIKMLPTPANFHYVFNLRDLSRIWQGMLTIQDAECQDEAMVLKLWVHECTRVIADRFTRNDDRIWFANCLRNTASEYLGEDFEYYPDSKTWLYFVDFLRPPPEITGDEPDDFDYSAPKIYELGPSKEEVLKHVYQFQESYNDSIRGASMDLVFFDDALSHLLIISRIIRTSRGNALLVGVGGSGKQSLTKLASFIAGYGIFQITITRVYNINNLLEDLKILYKTTGFMGQGLSFLFTDNEIKEESFLEYLNNILNSGEIANLFPKDEMDELINNLIPIMKKKSPTTPPTVDNLYNFFITTARSNLHLVLCFSPVGEKFRIRSMKFPGLISGCTVDWFTKWPRDALEAVSSYLFKGFPIVGSDEIKESVILTTSFIQDNVSDMCTSYFERYKRQTYVTPKSFLSFLSTYKRLYISKHENIKILADKMTTGLDKLEEAARSVDSLQKELAVKEKEIAAANQKAQGILETVMAATTIATKIKEQATATKEKAEALVEKIGAASVEAEAKLEAARPALEEAEAALLTIKGADIATVRKLGKPPYLITLIMDCVCILFKRHIEPVKPDLDRNFLVPSWQESLRVMADTNFLRNLQQYPKDTINAEIVDLMTPYLNYPIYKYENAKAACGNVAGLIQWTISMAAFYEVNKDVLPLKANLAKQKAKLEKAMKKLNAAMELLKAKEAEVAACQKEYDEAMESKRLVMEKARICQEKMDAATALINGLSGEKIRWTEASKQFEAQINRLVGDILFLTAFLSYTGPFNQEYRSILLDGWIKEINEKRIPFSSNINIIDSLTDPATVGEWNLQGLPTDELSIQNGIIVTQAARYPLLIDPQTQGKKWITTKENENKIVVTTLSDKWFRQYVEYCVSLGYPLLIQDIPEELDPVLDHVLEKHYIKIGNTLKVKVGDKEVDIAPDFRLYITTKLPNPKYSPEVFARTSIIDFAVTMKGLEDQLLGRVILAEKKELEEERVNLVTDVTANKRKMKELEDNLLIKLTSTQGSLVDDVTVIQVLNTTKDTAAQVNEKLNIARETEKKINAAREEFRIVANRGSVLYFLIVAMADVNCMYQTSLMQFLERFDISLELSQKSLSTVKRLKYIVDYLTYEIFRYQSTGLYNEHKYMFVLMMTLRIDLERQYISNQEFEYIIKGGAALDLNACPPKVVAWISDATWLNLVELSKLRQYLYIINQVASDIKQWKAWFEKDAPEEHPMPNNYSSLDVYRQLLLIRAWCPDRILAQARKYIKSSLGPEFAEAIIVNYENLFKESRPTTPIICFLSMGSDPTPGIEALAKRLDSPFGCMSMGQGQEVHARKLMATMLENGGWVLLQNCHLSLGYMEEVSAQIMEMEKSGKYHADFRLWLTSEPHLKFPITLLHVCIKFTNEPPSGIKAGLKRTYVSMSQDWLDYSTSPFYLPLIFGVSYLYTIIQERRKFGPIGWNIPYEFNSADWLCCCMFVQNHLDELSADNTISWVTIRYMFGEVHFGGRVTDDFDKRLLNTFCRRWFGEFMFAPTFKYYTGYTIMKYKVIPDYLKKIEQMSNVDPPQAYGLHPNADITFQSNTATTMLGLILSIQPKESGAGGGETREQVVTRIATNMLAKTPPLYDMFAVNDRLKVIGETAPMNICLKQEIDRMQKVLKLVRTTLSDLLLAIEGIIIMNEDLQFTFDCIYDAKIPPIWLRFSWESSALGFWFTELLERNAQFYEWCFVGRPLCFWMTGFFNPQGFLTSMRQEVARAHKGWALDTVMLHNTILKQLTKDEINTPCPEGVYVYGLYLDGAGWDRKAFKMVEATKKVLYTSLPVMHIFAINTTAPKDSKLYECPIYKKPRRTGLTYIDVLWLPSDTHPDHWVLRGVAMLCDIK